MIGLVAICIVQSPGLVYDGGRSVVEVTALEKWNLSSLKSRKKGYQETFVK